MKTRIFVTLLVAFVATAASGQSATRPATAGEAPAAINLLLNQALIDALPPPDDDPMLDPTGAVVLDAFGHPVSDPNERYHKVVPRIFDPYNTHLVQSTWLDGIGCPTGAKTAPFLPPNFDTVGSGTYTDPACPTGDAKDKHNEGLLMVKTGPTNNDAAAVADLKKVRGTEVRELGYDIRKKDGSSSPLGSHCGAGAPRFDVYTSDGFWAVGCHSPMANQPEGIGDGFTRLRWGTLGVVMGFKDNVLLSPITGTVKRISIIFDEGYDTGPDFFGAAILDNVDYNGTLVGRGPMGPGMHDDPSKDDDDDD
jgi:hypothetical protein